MSCHATGSNCPNFWFFFKKRKPAQLSEASKLNGEALGVVGGREEPSPSARGTDCSVPLTQPFVRCKDYQSPSCILLQQVKGIITQA